MEVVMRRRHVVGATVLVLLVGATVPAGAEPNPPTPSSQHGRFTRYDLDALGDKIVDVPDGVKPDQTVTALVQLAGDPVAVQKATATRSGKSFDPNAARQQVRATQRAAKPAIAAAGATVTGQVDQVLNAVRVRVKARNLAKLAAVSGVKRIQVSRTFSRDNGTSDKYTGVDQEWQDLGFTGEGVTIGVIDDGLDYTHADFGGPGTPAAYEQNDRTIIEPGTFPTAKVTGGTDFVGDAYDADGAGLATIPAPDPDPIGCGEHGTHVSGTAAGQGVLSDGSTYAGPYDGSTLSKSFNVAPGSAPEAKLKIYKVFGCEGTVTDDIVVAAIDRAVADGVNVINMSLGSTFGTPNGLDVQAVDNATKAGVMVVTSAGNEGPSAYVVGSPSTADTALSVAAMDASFAQFPALTITGAGVNTAGLIANGVDVTTPISGTALFVGLGCDEADYAGAAGKVVVSVRGTCDRVDRAKFGQAAGAVAVIMINNAPGLPPFEGPIEGVTIPFVGVDEADADALEAADGQVLTLTPGATIPNPDFTAFASFSSNGPRGGDSAQKPDITAPGVSLLSAGVGTGTGGIRISGTSMASPHTAGIAALVRQAHPTWTPAQVKAALMSTADPSKVLDYDSQRGGTGLVQARRAADTAAIAWTTDGRDSLTFGFKELIAGFFTSKPFKITNTSNQAITYDISTEFSGESNGATTEIWPKHVTVGAGQTVDVNVGLRLISSKVDHLPEAIESDGGALTTVHGVAVATPRRSGAGVYSLRLPFMFVPKGVSEVRADSLTLQREGTDGSGTFTVRNWEEHPGDADVYQWSITDPAGDATDPDVADLIDVGVQSLPGEVVGLDPTDRLIVFAVNTNKGTSTQAIHEVDITIDVDGDDTPDFVTVMADFGLVTTGTPDGTLGSFTFNLVDPDQPLVDAWAAVGPANGSVVEMPVSASALQLTPELGTFTFSAAGATILHDAATDTTTTATFDPYASAVSTGAFVAGLPKDKKVKVSVTVDFSKVATQQPLGWLVVTLDDAAGLGEGGRVHLP
jgi:subtilisin family serine protease